MARRMIQIGSEQELRSMYIDQGMTAKEIAAKFGVSKHTVSERLRMYGIYLEHGRTVPLRLNEQRLREMYDSGKTLLEMATEFNCTEASVYNYLVRYGIYKSKETAKQREKARREAKRSLTNNFYTKIFLPDHPAATKTGYINEHRVIAEEAIGRYLKPGEIVHHNDLNKLNNSPDNLTVFASWSDHLQFHKYYELIGLYMSGISKTRPNPYRPESPAFYLGEWVEEIDLIGARLPVATDPDFNRVGAQGGSSLIN